MEPILALPPDQFRAALTELGLDPEREAGLIRQYNEINGPQEGAGRRGMMYNLLDNIIGYDDDIVTPGERLGAGVQGFASGLLSDPLGTGADVLRGGYETIERAMAPGATPMDVLGAAGMAMGAGGMAARPAGSVGMGGRPRSDFGQDWSTVYHSTRSPNTFDAFDPDLGSGATSLLGAHVGTRAAAIDRRKAAPTQFAEGQMLELRADLSRPFLNPATGNPWSEIDLMDFVAEQADNLGVDYFEAPAYIRRMLAEEGFTDIPYINDIEDPGSVSNIMLVDRPRNSDAVLRRSDAAFDPARRTDPNLFAANVDPLTGAAAMGASQQDNDPLANLRAYLAQNGLLSQ